MYRIESITSKPSIDIRYVLLEVFFGRANAKYESACFLNLGLHLLDVIKKEAFLPTLPD